MTFTITNARIFDGVQMSPHNTVRVSQGLVEAVGGSELLRADIPSVDTGGGILLPGLIDSHVHLLPGAPQQAVTFGVTTIIDQFSKPDVINPILERDGDSGAHVRTSSIGATAPGGHPTMAYSPFPYVHGPQDAAPFVADRVSEGATHLKILYDDGSTSPVPMPSLDLVTVRRLVEAAHARGLVVVAHVMTAGAAIDVVAQGVDVLAHVPFDLLSDAQGATLKAAGIAVIGTLDIADGFPDSNGVMPLLKEPLLVRRLGAAWTDMLQRQAQRWMPPGLPDFAVAAHNVGALHAAGVSILAGTDAPNPGLIHGASLHRELQHLVAAGLSPMAALAAATSGPADAFGLRDRGAIRAGVRADLLLVRGNPDQDISATQSIDAVWRNGAAVGLHAFAGSEDESSSMAALQATNDKIMAAVRQMFPST